MGLRNSSPASQFFTLMISSKLWLPTKIRKNGGFVLRDANRRGREAAEIHPASPPLLACSHGCKRVSQACREDSLGTFFLWSLAEHPLTESHGGWEVSSESSNYAFATPCISKDPLLTFRFQILPQPSSRPSTDRTQTQSGIIVLVHSFNLPLSALLEKSYLRTKWHGEAKVFAKRMWQSNRSPPGSTHAFLPNPHNWVLKFHCSREWSIMNLSELDPT